VGLGQLSIGVEPRLDVRPPCIGRTPQPTEDGKKVLSLPADNDGKAPPEARDRKVQKLRPVGTPPSPVFEPTLYTNTTIKMFDYLRSKIGFDVELLHDVHERVPPNQAIQLCKAVELYRPFFMEDPFSPEDVAWFRTLRQQTSCAIAMG
jgi:mannonate dehydratase